MRRKTYDFTLAGRFVDQKGLRIETDAQVTAAVYDADSKRGIILGDGSTGKKGSSKVKLNLDPEGWDGHQPGKMFLHRQDGTSQALSARLDGDTVSFELDLECWETAVVEILPREMPCA